jgi:hypothetical protein
MSRKFIVRSKDYDEEWSRTVEAYDREDAAERVAAEVHSYWDYPSEFDFQVDEAEPLDNEGPAEINVEVRAEPVFTAAKRRTQRSGT